MPILPLPPEATLSGGDVPVSDASDVLAVFPRPHRNPATAPVRDAFTEAFAAGHIEYQILAEQGAAQTDPLRATGIYLRDKALERGLTPGPNETDASIRARMFASPEIVTPDAIEAAVNSLIAPLTCKISELELDGWFVHGSSAPTYVWDSFVGAEPNYPDRYYDDLPQTLPGGCVPSNGLPGSFHVRVPALTTYDSNFAFVFTNSSATDAFFVGTDSYVFKDQRTATDVYEAIIGRVQAIKGQGKSWSLFEDPKL